MNFGHLIYWLVVAVLCAFIAYGRIVINLLNILKNKKVFAFEKSFQ